MEFVDNEPLDLFAIPDDYLPRANYRRTITPGGLGVAELGLIATLSGTATRDVAQVTAAVLLYRAATYLPPIPLGAIACLTWRHAPPLFTPSPPTPGRTGQLVVCRRAMTTTNGQQVSVDRNRRSTRPRSVPPWVWMTRPASRTMNTAVTTAQP